MKNKQSIVLCKLPKAGLGNQLFPLMRATTFAHINNLTIRVTNYRQFKPGPWMRREKSKRNYNGIFTFRKSILAGLADNWKLKKYKPHALVKEPHIARVAEKDLKGHCFYFSAIPHYTKYFDDLKENRQLVIELLWNFIKPKIRESLKRLTPPAIGVHIRMGDFRKLREGEKFGETGTVRTPEKYFIEIIQSIRKIHGRDLPVSIFTDGSKVEFEKLFELNNVHLIDGNNDLEDLLLLSKSKIIVTSAGSTFSYWAGFLSEAAIIMHPTYVNMIIRPEDINESHYYGALDEHSQELCEEIQAIL